jgi:hypothetical protein
LESSNVVAVNADKIIFFINNVSSMILKCVAYYSPHTLCVTLILCVLIYMIREP